MVYAQFYTLPGVEACGDRSVIIIDGRLSFSNMCEIAWYECRKRGYMGYTLHKGDAFTRSRKISAYQGNRT